MAIISAIIGYVGYNGMNKIQAGQDEIATVILPSIVNLEIIDEAQTNIKAQEVGLMVRRFVGADRQHFYDKSEVLFKSIEDAKAIYTPLPHSNEEATAWKEFLSAWEEWVKDHNDYITLNKQKDELIAHGSAKDSAQIASIDSQIMDHYVNKMRPSYAKSESLMMKVIEINNKESAATDLSADEASSSAMKLLIILLTIGVLLAAIFGFLISSNIQNIIKSVIKQTKDLIEATLAGKLATRARPRYQ